MKTEDTSELKILKRKVDRRTYIIQKLENELVLLRSQIPRKKKKPRLIVCIYNIT